jgi:hypothetical protein
MKNRTLALVAALAGASFVGTSLAIAATAATSPLSYDDPGMHFQAPDGWLRFPGPEESTSPGLDQKTTLVAYGFANGKNDSRVISITAEPFEGTLDGAESSHETELRNGSDTTLVDKKMKVTLANGMPAWFLRVSQGSDPFTAVRLYQYVVYDGTREIVTTYSGRQFNFSEDDAKKALASLYVVVYPNHRP